MDRITYARLDRAAKLPERLRAQAERFAQLARLNDICSLWTEMALSAKARAR